MLEFVDSDLYFVQDKNNFINPLLQVGSGSWSGSGKSWSVEKITGSGSGGPKITVSDRIRILIPGIRSISVAKGPSSLGKERGSYLCGAMEGWGGCKVAWVGGLPRRGKPGERGRPDGSPGDLKKQAYSKGVIKNWSFYKSYIWSEIYFLS